MGRFVFNYYYSHYHNQHIYQSLSVFHPLTDWCRNFDEKPQYPAIDAVKMKAFGSYKSDNKPGQSQTRSAINTAPLSSFCPLIWQ